jgi:hypothetical protein
VVKIVGTGGHDGEIRWSTCVGLYTYFIGEKIPRPFSYYTKLFIFDYATYHQPGYYNYLNALLTNEANLLFFIKNILSVSSDGGIYRINESELDVYLPKDNHRRLFLQRIKNMDISILTEEQKKWREFAIEYFESQALLRTRG